MCIHAIGRVLKHSRSKLGVRLVAIALAHHCDKEGRCWPSITTLADETSLDRRHVERALKQLRGLGEFEVVGRGYRGTNVYQMRLATSDTGSASDETTSDTGVGTTSDISDVTSDISDATSDSHVAQTDIRTTILEQPLEHKEMAPAPYAFEGNIIRLRRSDFDRWQINYHAIPDLMAELCALDDYYNAELLVDERKKWFVRCSNALKNKHDKLLQASEAAEPFDPYIPEASTPCDPNHPVFAKHLWAQLEQERGRR